MDETKVQKVTQIVSAKPLNGRSLRIDFDDGELRLFDGYRLRGPKFIPLTDPEAFIRASVKDGKLVWEELNIEISPTYVRRFSVPYDPDYNPADYVPTKKERIGAKVATFLFPIMAIAGIIGTVFWWINN